MINRNLADLLKNEEVFAIEAIGKPFDPQYHQPLMTEPSDEYPAHTVIHEFQKGYMYKDRVIRPSLVKVSEEK
jgi:molecular chaperone GrpE